MTPAAEPLSLRLPRDLLVLQPMQGHLDVEPVLLAPGLRCVIGSAEGCAVRLTKSALVRPEHCVVEVIGRQTLLTEWEPEATWLNDRLVNEPTELVPGDRIAVGPFDFRVRAASADELLYAKLIERESGDASTVEDVLRLKRAIDNSAPSKNAGLTGSNREPALGLFGELLRATNDGSDSNSHERLTQHISKLLGDLQSQVLTLQEREAELTEQLRWQGDGLGRQRIEVERPETNPPPLPPASVPTAVRPEYEEVLQLLAAERAQLDRDRAQLSAEQTAWQEQQRDWAQRLQSLESQLADLEAQRQSVLEERDVCRALAAELMHDEARMAEWENRLREEERALARDREELSHRKCDLASLRANASLSETKPAASTAANSADPARSVSASWAGQRQLAAESQATTSPSHPVQALLTLATFSLAALFLSGSLGNHQANPTVGWGMAILGAISTVDLLVRRVFSSRR